MRWLPLTVLLSACTCASSHEADAGDSSSPDTTPAPDTAVVPDIGPPDGPVVTDCLSGFDAIDGQACDFEGRCHAVDLCCSAESSCFDGRLRVFNGGHAACLGESEPTGCVSPDGGAMISGTTPLGAVDLRYAHASFSSALAVDVIVMFTVDRALSTCETPRLSLFFGPSFEDPDFSYLGTHEVVGQLVTDDGVSRSLGTVEILAEEREIPGVLDGMLRFESAGWDVWGSFRVEGCPDIDRSGP